MTRRRFPIEMTVVPMQAGRVGVDCMQDAIHLNSE
jgi:hypothetical protein